MAPGCQAAPIQVTLQGAAGSDNASGNASAGGDAVTTLGDLNLSPGDSVNLLGGVGGNATGVSGDGGAGGDAALLGGGAVTVVSGGVTVLGGNGGASASATGGAAGGAAVSLGDAQWNHGNLVVEGGAGGSGPTPGPDGGASLFFSSLGLLNEANLVAGLGSGGSTDLTVSGAFAADDSLLFVNDGAVAVTLGSASFGNHASLTLSGITGPAALSVAGALGAEDSFLGVTGTSVSAAVGSVTLVNSGFQATSHDGGVSVLSAGSLSVSGESGNLWARGRDVLVSEASASVSNGAFLSVEGVDSSALSMTGDLSVSQASVTVDTAGGSSPGTARADLSVGGALSVTGGLVQLNGGKTDLEAGSISAEGATIRLWGGTSSVSAGSLGLGGDSYLVVGTVSSTTGILRVTGDADLGDDAGGGTVNVYGADASVSLGGDLGLGNGSYLGLHGGSVGSGSLRVEGSVQVDGGGVVLQGGEARAEVGHSLALLNGGSLGLTAGSDGSATLAVGGSMTVGDATHASSVNLSGLNAGVSVGSTLSLVHRSTLDLLALTGGAASLSSGGVSLDAGSVRLQGGSATLETLSLDAGNASTLGLFALSNGSAGMNCSSAVSLRQSVLQVSGGSASLAAGSLILGNASSLGVTAGNGAASVSVASAAVVDDSAVRLDGSDASLRVGTLALQNGGTVDLGAPAGTASLDAASFHLTGGTARLAASSLALGNASTLTLNGVNGGSVSMALGNALSLDHSSLRLEAVGDSSLTAASVSLGASSALTVSANGFSNLSVAGTLAVQGGAARVSGGDVSVTLGSLDFSGEGGLLEAAATTQVSVDVGTLSGAGTLRVSAASASLRAGAGDFSGVLAGNAGLEKVGGGALTLRGVNTYSGATTVEGGSLLVGTGGTLGSSGSATVAAGAVLGYFGNAEAGAITVQNAGRVSFADSAQGARASLHGFAGSLVDVGASAGGVTLGAVDGEGDVALGAGRLAVGSLGSDATLSGVLSGSGGSLVKLGSGALTLTGDNMFDGGTILESGRLTAGSSSALGLGDVTLRGGLLACGNAHHQLTVQGDYAQSGSATLSLGLVGVHSDGDGLWVGGRASLGGTLFLSGRGVTPAVGDAFMVASAEGGLDGAFDAVADDLSDRRFTAVYLPQSVVVETLPGSFTDVSTNSGQSAVGRGLDAAYESSSPEARTLMARLGTLRAEEYPSVLQAMNPSALSAVFETRFRIATLQETAVENRLRDFLETPSDSRRAAIPGGVRFAGAESGVEALQEALRASEAASSQAPARRWEGFVGGDYGTLEITGDGNGVGTRSTYRGLTAAGADTRLRDNLAVGLLLGYQDAGIDAEDGGRWTLKGGQAGLYGLWKGRHFHARALALGGLENIDDRRASWGGTAAGSTKGRTLSFAAGGGYLLRRGIWRWGPDVSLQYTRASWDAFQETGSFAPESFPDQSCDSLSGDIGLRAWGTVARTKHFAFRPSLGASYVRELGDRSGSVKANVAGGSFQAAGPALGRGAARLEGALGVEWNRNATLQAHGRVDLGRDHVDDKSFGGEILLHL